MTDKDLRRITGKIARDNGSFFESLIETSIQWYAAGGVLEAAKTPEPMRPLSKKDTKGRFLACFTKKAQVDFSGTLKGGRSIKFEAKQTDGDIFTRDRLSDYQMNDLRKHAKLGALCFVLICFGQDRVYRIPWDTWDNMKLQFGRLHITEKDISDFRVPVNLNVIRFLDDFSIDEKNMVPWPELCSMCGSYIQEGGKICSRCLKKIEEKETSGKK